MTAAECVLWQSLKGRQLFGKKFRRQISIGRYIVDFYCAEARLVIELDGEHHFSITMDEYEAERTLYLEREGLKVIRFENKELYDNLEGCSRPSSEPCKTETSRVSNHPVLRRFGGFAAFSYWRSHPSSRGGN